jgi:hypothetical protein
MSQHQRFLSCKSQSDSVLVLLVALILTGVATAQEEPATHESFFDHR